MNHRLLLTGGARSGKSALAERIARSWDRPVVYVATATAGDADMADRIAAHRDARPADWTTVEEPVDLAEAVAVVDPDAGLVVDCLTLWVTNLYFSEQPGDLDGRVEQAATVIARHPSPVVVVTNEVGAGVVPATEDGRRFRDLLGRVNAIFAARLDETLLVVAGAVVPLTDPIHHLSLPEDS